MNSTLVQWQLLERTHDRQLATLSQEPMLQREIDYFRQKIGGITSGEELVADHRLYSFAMKAFGLESQIFAKGLMRKVFEEGVADKQAMANRMNDPKYKEIATAFGFAEYGNLKMQSPAAVQKVIDSFMQLQLEERQGEQNQAVRLAMYFERKAPALESWYDVLADPALAEVVRTSLGLPDDYARSDIDQQVRYLESRVKLASLKEPGELDRFIKRFAALWDAKYGPPSPAGLSVAALVSPLPAGGRIIGIDPALLTQISRFRL